MFRKLFFIGLALLTLPLTHAFAQADPLTTVVDLSDGYEISVPDGWEVEQDSQTGGFRLGNDTIGLFVLNPEQVSSLVDSADSAALDDLLVDLYEELYDQRPALDEIEATEVDGREAVSWSHDGQGLYEIFYVIRLSDDRPGVVKVFSERQVLVLDQMETVMNILASFDVAAGTFTTEIDFEPCLISTDQENTVQLRVGPGTNRSVLSSLDAGEEFAVTGRFVTDDGSVWYQLVKEEVLPNSQANEIWVAAADVEETGDCAVVVDVAAPPIIPIVTQPSADASGDVAAAAVPPTRGRWTVTFDATTTAACPSGTISVASSEVYTVASFTLNITAILDDQSAFLGDGGLFELQSDGYYSAPLDSMTRLYLRPTSETTMTGYLTIDDVCDITTGVTLTR